MHEIRFFFEFLLRPAPIFTTSSVTHLLTCSRPSPTARPRLRDGRLSTSTRCPWRWCPWMSSGPGIGSYHYNMRWMNRWKGHSFFLFLGVYLGVDSSTRRSRVASLRTSMSPALLAASSSWGKSLNNKKNFHPYSLWTTANIKWN